MRVYIVKVMNDYFWIDGKPVNTLSPDDRGLAYGDGVFETVLINNGVLVFEKEHFIRLHKSCNRLAIYIDWSALKDQIQRFIAQFNKQSGILKIIVTRGDGRGYNPAHTKWRSVLRWHSLPNYPQTNKTRGVNLFPCKTTLAVQPLLAGIKHLNRLEQVLARGEWNDLKFADGLLFDTAGYLIEGTMSNVFIVIDENLMTPDLSRCGVAGVMRQWIIKESASLLPVTICNMTYKYLEKASEVFICNSVYGLWPVIGYASLSWSIGEITRELQKKIEPFFNDQ